MKRARLYARVSTEEQAKKGLSIPVQIENLKQYCAENDYEIADIYIDNGISASTIVKRHEFVRMLNELQKNDTILITRLDRMSRNVYDANYLLNKFEPLNVRFKAILEDDIDTTTADGKFIFDLKVSLAERERKKTSERIKDIQDSKRAKGEWLGGNAPLGYKTENKKLVVDEKTAPIIQYLFNSFSSGIQMKYIRRHLVETYGRDFRISGLYNMLRNKRYIGFYGDEPLVSSEVFYKCDSMRKQTQHLGKVKSDRVYLFQGLIYCACGKKLICSTYKSYSKRPTSIGTEYQYQRYICNMYYYNSLTHHSTISEAKMERIFLKDLVEHIKSESFKVDKEPVDNEQSIEDIQKASEKQDRLKEMYIEGFISREKFDSEMASLEPVLNKQFDKAPVKLEVETIPDIIEFYKSLEKKEKQIFIASLVEKITISEDRIITIIYK